MVAGLPLLTPRHTVTRVCTLPYLLPGRLRARLVYAAATGNGRHARLAHHTTTLRTFAYARLDHSWTFTASLLYHLVVTRTRGGVRFLLPFLYALHNVFPFFHRHLRYRLPTPPALHGPAYTEPSRLQFLLCPA